MSDWQLACLIGYGALVCLVGFRHVLFSVGTRGVSVLTPQSPIAPTDAEPFVSILVPARNEAHGVEQCAQSLVDQAYANFEVLIIDDRSEDETAAIVERMVPKQPRLRLLRVPSLPPGWTGKTHALHFGQQQAHGEWLLFVDADTRLDPKCLSATLRHAIDHHVALLSLLPALTMHSFWEKAIQPFAGMCLMALYPLNKVNDPSAKTMGFANGQFILVRRTAYDAIGGHEAVKDRFVEDIHLGRLVRQAGLGLQVVLAPDLVTVRMYASLGEIVRGWSRILYSAVDCRPPKLYLLVAMTLVFSVLSYVAIIAGGSAWLMGLGGSFAKWIFGLGVLHEVLQATVFARIFRLSRTPVSYLAYRFVGVFAMLYVLFRTIRMCRTHEVTWRGTSYGRELRRE